MVHVQYWSLHVLILEQLSKDGQSARINVRITMLSKNGRYFWNQNFNFNLKLKNEDFVTLQENYGYYEFYQKD